nr:membrane protein insertion efficiency factor YidD [Acanthopleuribacter pedis]
MRKVINFVPVMLIQFYRYCISPMFPAVCRFHPSCSTYGLEAFKTYSLPKALFLTAYRILRCNPFSRGGYDPLPLPGESLFKTGVAEGAHDHEGPCAQDGAGTATETATKVDP